MIKGGTSKLPCTAGNKGDTVKITDYKVLLNTYIKRHLLFPTHKSFVCYKYIISNTDETFHNQLLLEMPENGIQVKGLHQGGGIAGELQ